MSDPKTCEVCGKEWKYPSQLLYSCYHDVYACKTRVKGEVETCLKKIAANPHFLVSAQD
jgi:hypothetical protein